MFDIKDKFNAMKIIAKMVKVRSCIRIVICLCFLIHNTKLLSQSSEFSYKTETALQRKFYNVSSDSLYVVLFQNQFNKKDHHDAFLIDQYKVLFFLKKELYDSALNLVNTMALEAEKSKNYLSLYRYHISAGILFTALQQFEAANDNFRKAINYTQDSSEVLSWLSSLYNDQQNFIDAVSTAVNVLNTTTLYQHTAAEQARFNLAKAYVNLDSIQKAEYLFTQLISAKQFKLVRLQALSLYAAWRFEKNDFSNSLLLSKELLLLADSLQYQNYITEAHILLSQNYSALKKIKEAELHLGYAKLSHANQPGHPFKPLDQELNLLEAEYDFYYGQAKYKNALMIKEKWALLYKRYAESRANSKIPFYKSRIYQLELENELRAKKITLQRQRSFILFISFVLLSVLVIGFLVFRFLNKSKKLKERELASLQKEQEYMAITSMLEGRLAERERIGKEIHDDLGASLTSISLLTEVLKKRVADSEKSEIIKISELSAELIGKLNDIIWALNDQNDSLKSLAAYLRKFADEFLKNAGIKLIFHDNTEACEVAVEGIKRRNIYLAAKEALHNIVKHSRATEVTVVVRMDQRIVITIQDNGVGFSGGIHERNGSGLKNMKSRMEQINGTFAVSFLNGTLIELVC